MSATPMIGREPGRAPLNTIEATGGIVRELTLEAELATPQSASLIESEVRAFAAHINLVVELAG